MTAIQYSQHDLGAVLVKARLLTSELMTAKATLWNGLERRATLASKAIIDEHDRMRMLAVTTIFRSSFWTACFSAHCYFQYRKIFIKSFDEDGLSDICLAANTAAHIHADIVPIELFNARELTKSKEILVVLGETEKFIMECFETSFPNVKFARDAVTHNHDRSLSRYNKNDLNSDVGGRYITDVGKIYVDHLGNDFSFDFTPEKFRRYLDNLEKLVDI